MSETNQIGNPSGIDSPHLPVNIQLAPKIFDTYTKLVKGDGYDNDVYFYRLRDQICLLKPSDTKNVKSSLISCLSMAVENRSVICPQANDCPMMYADTTVSLVDKRKQKNMVDGFEENENLFKPKKERKRRSKNVKTNAVQESALIDNKNELDPTELIHTSDTFVPETIASELMEKADSDLFEDATQEDIYLARKARAFLELITNSYKTSNPILAVEKLIDNAIKKIPEIKGKYQE